MTAVVSKDDLFCGSNSSKAWISRRMRENHSFLCEKNGSAIMNSGSKSMALTVLENAEGSVE